MKKQDLIILFLLLLIFFIIFRRRSSGLAGENAFTVYMTPTRTREMTIDEISTWNHDFVRLADGKILRSHYKNDVLVYGTDYGLNAEENAQTAAESGVTWADYPVSDRVLYESLMKNFKGLDSIKKIISETLYSQVNGDPCMDKINSIITEIGTDIPNLVPYTSEEQIITMFETAYSNGESSLSKTDKVILRVFTSFSADLFYSLKAIRAHNPRFIEKYVPTSDGKCPWSDAIFAQTGQNVRTNMISVMYLVKVFYNATTPTEVTDAINSILPAGMEAAVPGTFQECIISLLTSGGYNNPSVEGQMQTLTWFFKYMTAGPMYTWWLAKNKWNLDPNFNP